VLSGSKDGSIKLWDVAAGKCISTMFNRNFVGVEKIVLVDDADALRGTIRNQDALSELEEAEILPPEDNFKHKHMQGEIDDDTKGKVVFAGLSSGLGLLAAFDLSSKRSIIESFHHVPASASGIPSDRKGGAIRAIAYDSKRHLLASGSAKGIVAVRDTRKMNSKGDGPSIRIFARNQAAINALAFAPSESGSDLIVTPASGMPFRVNIPVSDDGSIQVVEEYAGWEAVPVNSVAVGSGEGNVWIAGGEGGIRQY
jgi:proteasomal ATPase-associated factor 1